MMNSLIRSFLAGLLFVSLNTGGARAGPGDEFLIADCMDLTGYAFAGGRSPFSFDADISFLFGNEFNRPIACDPFQMGGATVGAGSNLGSINYFAGIGMRATTIGSHTPETTGTAGAGLETELVLKFRVVPDDPQATGPIPIEVVTRFEFIDLEQVSSGTGYATNALDGYLRVNQYNAAGPSISGGYFFEAQGIAAGGSADFPLLQNALVNTDLFLRANLRQYSTARGAILPFSGSGAAALTAEVSFEVVAVNDDATIIWGIEEELGLAPPRLGEVPEPAFASSLLLATGLLASISRRSRKPTNGARVTR